MLEVLRFSKKNSFHAWPRWEPWCTDKNKMRESATETDLANT